MLTDKQVEKIREKAAIGVPTDYLADQFDCSESHIRNIVTGNVRTEAGGLIRGRDYEGRKA